MKTPSGASSGFIDDVFFALSHPVRRELLDRLAGRPMSVGSLSGPIKASPAAVTKHLKILERARLIKRDRRGREHILHFDPAALTEAAVWMRAHQEFWEMQLESFEDYLLTRAEKSRD